FRNRTSSPRHERSLRLRARSLTVRQSRSSACSSLPAVSLTRCHSVRTAPTNAVALCHPDQGDGRADLGRLVVISWAGLLLLGPVLRVALRRNSGTNAWRDLHAGRVHRNGVTVSANITAPCGRRLSP